MSDDTMLGEVQDATPRALGFDTYETVSPEVAQAFFADGYRFCVRYVNHHSTEAKSDITRPEAEGILAAGLALMIVQHVRLPGWTPTAALGASDGELVVGHARALGCPQGLSLWCDVEGFTQGVQASDVLAYCIAWYKAVDDGGFTPGLYVGTFLLTGHELFAALPFQHYWKSGMKVADVEKRGYQMIQQQHPSAHGIPIDQDTIQRDDLGGVPRWLVQRASAPTG